MIGSVLWPPIYLNDIKRYLFVIKSLRGYVLQKATNTGTMRVTNRTPSHSAEAVVGIEEMLIDLFVAIEKKLLNPLCC